MQSSFTKKFSEDKMQKLTDSYPRPQNCNALTSVKVNAGIWARMQTGTRSNDLKLQEFSEPVTEGGSGARNL